MEITPVPAATLILARAGSQGIEVLMGKRTETHGIFGQAHVFPGGQVEKPDHTFNQPGSYSPDDLAYRVAALRETAEEVGLWLTVTSNSSRGAVVSGTDGTPAEAEKVETKTKQGIAKHPPARTATPIPNSVVGINSEHPSTEKVIPVTRPVSTEPQEPLATQVEEERRTQKRAGVDSVEPQPEWAVSSLSYISTWVTPAGLPRRYHTRFYLADGAGLPPPSPTGTELTDTGWVTPQQAIKNGEKNKWIVHPPTYHHLRWIARFTELEHLLQTVRDNDLELVPQAELDTYPS